MTKKRSTTARKPRTDALRNRERILEVAKAAFTRQGANASLEEIAKQAGVGAGTLYRHFPTRDELIEGVYRNEVEKLAAAAAPLRRDHVSDRSASSLDAAAGRLHCGKAHHCARSQYRCRRPVQAL